MLLDEIGPVTGQELREYREGLGISPTQAAEILRCHRTTIWRLEQRPSVPYLKAKAYMTALRDFAGKVR